MDKEYTDTDKHKNLLEWSTQYRDKPKFLYPYTMMYLNYPFYETLKRDDFSMAYTNKLIISTFKTLPRILRMTVDKVMKWEKR